MTLQQLKNLDVRSSLGLDELIYVRAILNLMIAEYTALKLEIPEWACEKLEIIDIEIAAKTIAARKARKAQITAQLSALKTSRERRDELMKELAELG